MRHLHRSRSLIVLSSFFCLLFGFNRSYGQSKVDSLISARESARHDTLRVSTDINLGKAFESVNLDSALFYFDRALAAAQTMSNEYPQWEPKVLIARGNALTSSDLDEEAIAVFQEATDIAKERKLKKEQSNAQFGLGYAYMSNSDFKMAILHFDSVVVRNERDGTGYSQADCLNFSGLCNFYIRKLDIASEKALAAIRYRREVGDTTYIHNPYMVYALVQYQQGEYKVAKEYFKKVAHNARAVDDFRRVRLAYENLAFTLLEQDSADAAIENMTRAWEMSKQMKYDWGTVRYYNMVADVEIDRGNFQKGHDLIKRSIGFIKPSVAPQSKADIYLNLVWVKIRLADSVYSENRARRAALFSEALPLAEKSWKLASEVNSANVMLDAGEALATLYSNLNRYREAFEFSQKAKAISEDINDKARTEAIAKMTTEYETELVEAQNASLKDSQKAQAAELKQQYYLNYGMVIGLALILLVAIVIYRSRLKLQRAKVEIEKSLSERELLLKEIHHRVKNNLQVISSLLELQSFGIEDEKTLSTFMEGQNRVKAMALIHQKLYQNEDLGEIDFAEYAGQLSRDLANIYPIAGKVSTSIHADSQVKFDIDTAVPLGLILNELISNSYKYAFEGKEMGELQVSIASKGEGKHQLMVEDNGKGLSEGFDLERAKSLGLRLVNRLTEQLYGTVEYYGDHGAKFVINFEESIRRNPS